MELSALLKAVKRWGVGFKQESKHFAAFGRNDLRF